MRRAEALWLTAGPIALALVVIATTRLFEREGSVDELAAEPADVQRTNGDGRAAAAPELAPTAAASDAPASPSPRDERDWKAPATTRYHVRVELPTGTPPDERLTVVTRRSRFGRPSVHELDGLELDVEVPGRELWVRVLGRYVFTRESVRPTAPTAVGEPWTVRPELGGRIAGTLAIDPARLPDVVDGRALVTAVRTDPGPGSPVSLPSGVPIATVERESLPLDGRIVTLPADGVLEIPHLLPGRYRIELAVDWTAATSPRSSSSEPWTFGLPTVEQATEVEVVPGGTASLALALTPGVEVAGTLQLDGAPLERGRLTVECWRDGVREWTGQDTTDELGRFRWRAVPPGRLRLTLQSETLVLEPAELGARVAGERVLGLALVAHEGRRIEGRLVDSDGTPLAGTVVRARELVDLRGEGDRALPLGQQRIAITRADGRFELAGLAGHEYELTVQNRAPGSRPSHARLRARAGVTGLAVRLQPGELPPDPHEGLMCFE